VLAYVSGRRSERQYFWRDRQGKILGVEPDAGNIVAISPDGKRLLGDRSDDTWIWQIGGGTGTRMMFGRGNPNAIWSPDGRYIAYGNHGISRKPANGSGAPELLLQANGLVVPKSYRGGRGRLICLTRGAQCQAISRGYHIGKRRPGAVFTRRTLGGVHVQRIGRQ
jgi:Tol biopolymer transport system component